MSPDKMIDGTIDQSGPSEAVQAGTRPAVASRISFAGDQPRRKSIAIQLETDLKDLEDASEKQ